jgi:S-ribosylhomocysteine lyase
MHSLEHMFATFVRSSEIGGDVIYFGPMGCQTGFYLSTTNSVTAADIAAALTRVHNKVFPISSTDDIVGLNQIQCGNPYLYAIEETNEAMSNYIKVLSRCEF